MFFVTLTYKDIVPDKLLFKTMKMRLKKPFIHLQTGVCGIKALDETGKSFSNNMLRFLVYNKEMVNNLMEYNLFKDYQLYYNKYPPRYCDLIRKVDENPTQNQIFWLLSSREYAKEDPINFDTLAEIVKRVVKDEKLRNYLKENNLTLNVCTHLLLEHQVYDKIKKYEDELIKITSQQYNDFNLEIARSNLLITDYSSIVYDFSFLNKEYIIFQPDVDRFITKRRFYYKDSEMKEFIIRKPSELIDKIISGNYEKIPYIEKAKPDDIDFDYLKQNKHLDDFYTYFKNLQFNKITFLGYNFYGIGGTVNATMALAEALLEEGYFVDIISLKRLAKLKHKPPLGLNMQYITWDNSGSIREEIYKKIYRNPKYYSHLEFDYTKKFLRPYVGYELDNLMKNIRTNTLVSTRESLHLFLNDCSSENVKNKIFFFHAPADIVEDIFPNLMDEIKKFNIDKAVFITPQNRIALENNFDYHNYNKHIDIGNTLVQSKIIPRDEILPVEKKDKYTAIYLLRISKGRKKDLDNLIEFAKYVKDNDIDYIDIDVFGDGDYVNQFLNKIEKYDLSDIIHYKLSTENPIKEIREHDLMIDFSLNHSFGMIYIEAILNGKKVFCMENPGSLEVMEGIENSYIQSYEWLCNEIQNLDKITADELKENYDKIGEKYSQKAIARKFIDFIEKEGN